MLIVYNSAPLTRVMPHYLSQSLGEEHLNDARFRQHRGGKREIFSNIDHN